MDRPFVSAITLAHGEEPWLEETVSALLASRDIDVEVILVDNGCTSDQVARVAGQAGVTVLRPGTNLGFCAGCNLGVRHAKGDYIALVNGDAAVDRDALCRLVEAAARTDVGIASASVRLADDRSVLNSGGNDIHFLGFSWAGRHGLPADPAEREHEVMGACGGGLAMRREVWDQVGGFDEEYFGFHEDVYLSLRAWQLGFRVVYVPEARVFHHYEFSRNPRKFYLLERNREIVLLTMWEARTLVLIAPVLLLAEMAVMALAVRQGWWRQKVAAWVWLVRNRRWLTGRRSTLQGTRRVSDAELAPRLSARLDPTNFDLPSLARPLNAILAGYWGVVRRFLRSPR